MNMDWGDGTYELTAKTLEPAARACLDSLGALAGRRVLDVGCGTGNAALEAARRGAVVTGVDPALRLLEVARQRAADAKLDITFAPGAGASVQLPDASVDDAVSVFAIIFAPDARAVAAELKRVVKRGGRVALTAWHPRGAVFESSMILRKAVMAAFPAPPAGTLIPQWHDSGFVAELFGAPVTTREDTLHFTASSPEAWFAEQQSAHPAWRQASVALAQSGSWESVRAESIAALKAGNLSATAFDAVSPYSVHVINSLSPEAHS